LVISSCQANSRRRRRRTARPQMCVGFGIDQLGGDANPFLIVGPLLQCIAHSSSRPTCLMSTGLSV
jgi:hypothetical protein